MANTHKTVILTSLVAIFFFALLVVYRSQFAAHTVYVSENATMFPQGREIKPFQLMTADQKSFSQKDLNGHWTLLFFGFTHCASVCPRTLDMLSQAYDQLNAIKSNLRVVFVSLDPTRDHPSDLHRYTNHFHPKFIGLTGKVYELHQLQAQLHVYSEKDVGSVNENYQIQHTASILLINPQGKWAGLFNYGMRPKEFIREFREAVS